MKIKRKTIFPYQKNSQGQFFPIIPVTLTFQKKKADTSALIDSGATVSIFKEEMARLLGIRVESGDEYNVSLNLLGRDSFFDKFLITFAEEYKKSVSISIFDKIFDKTLANCYYRILLTRTGRFLKI